MKHNKTSMILILAAAAAASVFAAPRATIRGRQINQQQRIAQGVRSGQLTRGETARIEHQEAALHREIRRDRVDGGGLSAAERAKIQKQQNALSQEIYNMKHNGRTR